MYSQKVIDYFRHPHNYGRLKNPDGVGKVGNLVCLPPDQKIHVNNNLKKINKLSKKEKVLSHDGQYNQISKLVVRNYHQEIMTLKNRLGTVSVTPEHLILAAKPPRGGKFLRTKYRKRLASNWYHAEQLKKGDIVLFPILMQEKDRKFVEINIPKPKYDFKSKKLPRKVPLNDKLLRLFGYFLSEGHAQDQPCRTFITFTLNDRETEIAEDIKNTAKNLFNLDTVIRKLPQRKTTSVNLYSARLARLFKELFGSGAENKKIPDFIMNLSPRKQQPLIYGLWKGDGYLNLNRDGPRGEYSTVSSQLAQQMKVLLLRQKIVPSIYREKERKAKGVSHKKTYRIHVGQRDSLLRLSSILNQKYHPRSYPSEKAWFDNNFLYLPITGVKREKYQGKVYNLEVPNTRSFTSEAFCLHNCGDVMQLYIKVGKNSQGKEVIKDIKFETFGCVAAISTSSVVTDLAKGKTLQQALTINNDRVVESLGGLPPVKLHCSVLAADALAEAVYDYLSKNKKKIPPELKKRHQRINREKKIIEEKYQDWTKTEQTV